MIRFYCGINETEFNGRPVEPGADACVAPAYGRTARTHKENRVSIPCGTQVIQDSGAFADNWTSRLSLPDALRRQVIHSDKWCYSDLITHRASYDLLIDEKWQDGVRSKQRWSESEADAAVDTTVEAAKYLKTHYDGPAILSAQGVTARQYLKCVKRIAPLLDTEDVLGLGGWCIIGKMPKVMMPVFVETANLVIPYAAKHGVKRVHIWGVVYARALAALLSICDMCGVSVSTDSSGPSTHPCFGEWGYAEWRDNNYERPPVETRGLARSRHIQLTREWLYGFRQTKWYTGA